METISTSSIGLKRILKARELGEVLGVTERTVRKLTRRGVLPYFRIGRLLRYDLDRVLDALGNKRDNDK